MKTAQRRRLQKQQAAGLMTLLSGSREFGPSQQVLFYGAQRKYVDLLETGLRASFPFFMKHAKYTPLQLFKLFKGRGVNLDDLERTEVAYRVLKPTLSHARLDLLSIDRAVTRLRLATKAQRSKATPPVEFVRLTTTVLNRYPDFEPRRVRRLPRTRRVGLSVNGDGYLVVVE